MERSGNMHVTEKSYGVQPSRIGRWGKNYQKIKKFAEKSFTHVTVHPGWKLKNRNLENGPITVVEDYFE